MTSRLLVFVVLQAFLQLPNGSMQKKQRATANSTTLYVGLWLSQMLASLQFILQRRNIQV